jgi:hypothetical protein
VAVDGRTLNEVSLALPTIDESSSQTGDWSYVHRGTEAAEVFQPLDNDTIHGFDTANDLIDFGGLLQRLGYGQEAIGGSAADNAVALDLAGVGGTAGQAADNTATVAFDTGTGVLTLTVDTNPLAGQSLHETFHLQMLAIEGTLSTNDFDVIFPQA